jgi:hypothetical protein
VWLHPVSRAVCVSCAHTVLTITIVLLFL